MIPVSRVGPAADRRLPGARRTVLGRWPHAAAVDEKSGRSHLLGRISWVGSLNPARGARLRSMFDEIDWAG